MNFDFVYKICTKSEWRDAKENMQDMNNYSKILYTKFKSDIINKK